MCFATLLRLSTEARESGGALSELPVSRRVVRRFVAGGRHVAQALDVVEGLRPRDSRRASRTSERTSRRRQGRGRGRQRLRLTCIEEARRRPPQP